MTVVATEAGNGATIDDGLNWWASNDDCDSQTVFLYRKEGGTDCLLDRYTVDQQSMPSLEDFQFAVKEQHGGGVYQAMVRKPNGQMIKRIPFSLGGLPKRQVETAAASAPAAQAEGGLEKALVMLMQQNQQMQQQFLTGLQTISQQIAAKPEKPDIDAFDMLERAANILGKSGATPPVQKSLLEQITELKQVTELIGLAGGGSAESGWGSIAALAAPLVDAMKENTITERMRLEMVADQQKQRQQTPVRAVRAVSAPANNPFSGVVAGLAPVLPQLIEAAEKNYPADAIASRVLSVVPVEQRESLRLFLARDEALADMVRLEPRIDKHFEWFALLANEMSEQLSQTDDAKPAAKLQSTDTGRGTGNADNAATDGAADQARPRKRKGADAGAGAGAGA